MSAPTGQQSALSRLECFAFMVAMLGVQLSSELYAQWGTYFYSPTKGGSRIVYVTVGLVAVIFVAGRVIDLVTDPLIGALSDRSSQSPGRLRLLPIAGRRRPFIFWGAVLMTFTGVAFWYPPVAETSTTNLVYGTTVMSLHWVFYTLAYIPILALAPEIARSDTDRMRLGTWIGIGMIIGLVAAVILPGVLIDMLDPARRVIEGETPEYSPIGYQRVAIIFAVFSLASFLFFIACVRERPLEESEISRESIYGEIRSSLRLPVFRFYILIFFLFYVGQLANQRAMPYWVELGIGGDESTLTVLGLPFIATCLVGALICKPLAKKITLKWLVVMAVACLGLTLPGMYIIAVVGLSNDVKLILAAAIWGLNGFGQGMIYVLVTPLIGAIIDANATLTGKRQEAVFNALHATMVKTAQVFGIVIATQLMARAGNSSESPLGVFLVAPIAGVFCIAALILATQYPNLHSDETE